MNLCFLKRKTPLFSCCKMWKTILYAKMLRSFIGLVWEYMRTHRLGLGKYETAEHTSCPDGSVFQSPRLCFWSRRGTPSARLPPWRSLTARWICGPWGDWGELCSSAVCVSWPSITASKAEGGAVAGLGWRR